MVPLYDIICVYQINCAIYIYIYTYIYAAIVIICYCLCVYGLCIWTIYHHYVSYDTLMFKKENCLANSPKLSLPITKMGNQLDRIGWSMMVLYPQVYLPNVDHL